MDRANNEIALFDETVAEASEPQIRDLNELQLALVGGGSGDTILH